MCEYFCSCFAFFSTLSQSPPRSHLPLFNSPVCLQNPLPSSSFISQRLVFIQPLRFLSSSATSSFRPFHFISFHQPAEQKRNAEESRAVLSNTMSRNVRTRSLLQPKAHCILTPRNAVFSTRCSGNVAECVLLLIALEFMVFIKFY